MPFILWFFIFFFNLYISDCIYYDLHTANLSHLTQTEIIELTYIDNFYKQYNTKRFPRSVNNFLNQSIDEEYSQIIGYENQLKTLDIYVNLYKSVQEEDIITSYSKSIFYLDIPIKKKTIRWVFDDRNLIRVYPYESLNVRNLLHYAFSTWEQYIDVEFEYNDRNYDIYISFEKYAHGDDSPFDGPGGVNAHAYLPSSNRKPQLIHFDLSERWQFQYNYTNNNNVFFIETAIHEIGHSLGLKHPFLIPQSVMHGLDLKNSFYKRNSHISNYDIYSIRRLYRPKIQPDIEKIIFDRREMENKEEFEFLLYRKNKRLEQISNIILNIKNSLNMKLYLPSVLFFINSKIYDVLLNEYKRNIKIYYIDGDFSKLFKSYENLYKSSNNLPLLSTTSIPETIFCNSTIDSIIFIEGVLYITKNDKIWKQAHVSHNVFYGPFSMAIFLNDESIKKINGAYKKNNDEYVFLSGQNLYEVNIYQNITKIYNNELNITTMAPFFYDSYTSVIAIAYIGGCPQFILFDRDKIPSLNNYSPLNLNYYPLNIKFIFNYGEKVYLISDNRSLIIINFNKKTDIFDLTLQPWFNCDVDEKFRDVSNIEKTYFNIKIFRKEYIERINNSIILN